jgi:hypothetical protein
VPDPVLNGSTMQLSKFMYTLFLFLMPRNFLDLLGTLLL